MRAGVALVRVAALALVDQAALIDDVAQPVREPHRGREPVTPRAARLLVVALDALGQVQVGDEAHVRFVDPHPERNGRDDDDALLPHEPHLGVVAHRGVQPRVVRQGGDTVVVQPRGCGLHALAGQAVDDPGLALVLGADQVQQLIAGTVLGFDPVLDVGPVEVRDEVLGLPQLQALGDLPMRGAGGRGRQGDPGDVRERMGEHRQAQVVRAEVMAPLSDAVCLVDREQGDPGPTQQVQGARQDQPFRGHVEQVQLPGERPLFHRLRLVRLQCGVEVRRADPHCFEGGHLVRHERDQRGDHDPGALPDQRGDLVAQRLPPTCGHEHDCVPAGHHVVDDGRLLTPEPGVPEDLPQDVQGRGGSARGMHASTLGPLPGRMLGADGLWSGGPGWMLPVPDSQVLGNLRCR